MKVNLVAFGIARDILGCKSREFQFNGHNIGQLKDSLVAEFPEFTRLKKLSFAVSENYEADSFVLKEGLEVVIIPPVSGG